MDAWSQDDRSDSLGINMLRQEELGHELLRAMKKACLFGTVKRDYWGAWGRLDSAAGCLEN